MVAPLDDLFAVDAATSAPITPAARPVLLGAGLGLFGLAAAGLGIAGWIYERQTTAKLREALSETREHESTRARERSGARPRQGARARAA